MKGWYRENYRHSLASKGIRTSFRAKRLQYVPDVLPGGKADYLTVKDVALLKDAKVNKVRKQFRKGLEVESEHTADPVIQSEIAKDHLMEDTSYYDKLEKMESKPRKKVIGMKGAGKYAYGEKEGQNLAARTAIAGVQKWKWVRYMGGK